MGERRGGDERYETADPSQAAVLGVEVDTNQTIAQADDLRRQGRVEEAIAAYQRAALTAEIPPLMAALGLARSHADLGETEAGYRWLLTSLDGDRSFTGWQAASGVFEELRDRAAPPTKRRVRLALLGSSTTAQMVPMLELAALRRGIELEIYEGGFGQYRQELIDPQSDLYRFSPDFIVIAVHHRDLQLPDYSESPESAVESELDRWLALWSIVRGRTSARVIQYNFAIPPEVPFGHLSTRLPGSRYRMLRALNARLGDSAPEGVAVLDCERLSAWVGKERWFDDRYWHLAKQAVSLDAVPTLARHIAAVVMADLGLSRKCLVLDLDNTLWGGVIGEDGLPGLRLGHGAQGEAFVAFQKYLLELKAKGIVLAVCSKNNEADARSPFEEHPDMVIHLDDLAVFFANWDTKVDNLRRIARTLNIGLDALVFVDDNPTEREIVRQMLPEVEVVPLPSDPALYVRAIEDGLYFETASFTAEDAQRTGQYRARAEVARLEASAGSMEDFYRSLHMKAEVAPFDDIHLPRIVQLLGKTNQFNLTTRRHDPETVRRFMRDPNSVNLYLKLRDRFADHGLVGVIIAKRDGEVLEVDTWLMSCRVIGRTVEDHMLARLSEEAQRLGCSRIRGVYIPTAKNTQVAQIYERFGFVQVSDIDGVTVWDYDLEARGNIPSDFIEETVYEHA